MTFDVFPSDEDAPRDGFRHGPVNAQEARQSIDDLVSEALRYQSSQAYRELLRFVGGFRRYAPFNALLIHTQRSGARYVAPAHRWRDKYRRRVKPGEQPLVALQPFGPVMFVYDVSQTEPEPGAEHLPIRVINPFAMPPMVNVEPALTRTIGNAKADGVRVTAVPAGSQSAGCIRMATPGLSQEVVVRRRPLEATQLPIRYEVEINRDLNPTERFATLAHELGHLYCGHMGTPNPKWWPDRHKISHVVMEFEAESVAYLAYLACQRIDEGARMPVHLAQYLDAEPRVPEDISLERIMIAAGRVVEMGIRFLGLRKAER